MRALIRTTAILAIMAGAGGAAAAETATAMLKGPDGAEIGAVTLSQYPHGVLMEADLKNLSPGVHGFHVHQTGACAPDFKAAGDHFAPAGNGHGYATEDGPHAGDLPNIFVADDGTARASAWNTRITISEGTTALMDGDGAAIIVHEKPDSYQADAGAGGRAACGVIETAD